MSVCLRQLSLLEPRIPRDLSVGVGQGQKKKLPIIKQDLVLVDWSGELLDFASVPSQTLQEVCKRVKLAFTRFISGDKNGKRIGKPRFKNTARFRSMIFEGVKLHSCSIGGKWLYVSLPKLGLITVRHHRSLPDGAVLKQAQVIKKVDGWYINLRLQDDSVPDFTPDIIPTWENSLGMDAVLYEDDYLATSEGFKLPSLKSFRNSQAKLTKISTQKNARKQGSKARRKLAKKEGRIHGKIARARKAGAVAIPINPAYTSQLLAYKDEFVFTDCSIRDYWDEELKLMIDRDINSGINLKRVGLDVFPTIKRRKGNPVVVASTTNSTSKQVLSTLRGLEKPTLYLIESV